MRNSKWLYCWMTLFLFFNVTLEAQWEQLGTTLNGEAVDDESGWSVSLSSDGSRLAIGAPRNDGTDTNAGHVRVYEWSGSTWVQLGDDIDGPSGSDNSGWSTSLSSDGNRIAIGIYGGGPGDIGQAKVYEWSGMDWELMGSAIDGENPGDQFGYSISLSADGNTVAIGSFYNADAYFRGGHARIYRWNGTAWNQLGQDIDAEGVVDLLGFSLSLSADGNTIAVGALSAGDKGNARVYTWSGTQWNKLGGNIEGDGNDDRLGSSVSLSADGSILAIGAPYNDSNGADAGQVKIYEWTGLQWEQLGVNITGDAGSDRLGSSVSLSADGIRLAIGAPYNDVNGADARQVKIYEWTGLQWEQLGVSLVGAAAGDRFGSWVSFSMDGNRLAIGAPFNDGSFQNAGHARVYTGYIRSSGTGGGGDSSVHQLPLFGRQSIFFWVLLLHMVSIALVFYSHRV